MLDKKTMTYHERKKMNLLMLFDFFKSISYVFHPLKSKKVMNNESEII